MKKAVLKHFVIFTGKHLCRSIFLTKLIKKKLQHTVFCCEYCKIFRSIFREIKRFSILQNICERLFERFPTGTNNIIVTSHIHMKRIRRFLKMKLKKTILKLSQMEKTSLFMFFIMSFFSISPLHVSRCLPWIKDDRSEEDFRTA